MPGSQVPGPLGRDPFLASTRTGGPLGTNKDAADPDTPDWFLGDTQLSTGRNPNKPTRGKTLLHDSPKPEPVQGKEYSPRGNFILANLEADFDIRNIPQIMETMKCSNGQRLMEEWFGNPPKKKPEYCAPDTTTIRMETWYLKFKRGQKLYDELVARLGNEPTRELLLKRIKVKGERFLSSPDHEGWESFGNLPGVSVPQMEKEEFYVNSIPFSPGVRDPIDDMFCALGSHQLRMVVKGRCRELTPTQKGAKRKLGAYILQVGVYVFDSYDFNDDPGKESQDLGYWTLRPPSASTLAGEGRFHVTNQDFQDFRNKYKKGGDFQVFSDIYWKKLDTALTYVFEW